MTGYRLAQLCYLCSHSDSGPEIEQSSQLFVTALNLKSNAHSVCDISPIVHPSPIDDTSFPCLIIQHMGSILLLLHNFLSPCPSTTSSLYRHPYSFHLILLSSTNLLSSPAAHIPYSYLCWNSASTALLCLACTTSSAPLHR